MENTIEIKNICKKYDDFNLSNISFELPKGYIMGLIGPNGAGKTTLIKIIMDLIKPQSGEVKVFNSSLGSKEVSIKQRIGYVADVPAFYNHLTIKKMSKIISRFYLNWDNNKFVSLLDKFQLSLDQKIQNLSRGMNEKFALAIALSHNADLIILDEPTSGLDPLARNEFLQVLFDIIQDDNKSILFSTHITSDLEKIADYITFLHNGKLVFSDPKDEILSNWKIVKGGNNLLNEESKKLFEGIRVNNYGFEALTSDKNKAQKYFGEGIIFEKPTLEDIMYFVDRGRA